MKLEKGGDREHLEISKKSKNKKINRFLICAILFLVIAGILAVFMISNKYGGLLGIDLSFIWSTKEIELVTEKGSVPLEVSDSFFSGNQELKYDIVKFLFENPPSACPYLLSECLVSNDAVWQQSCNRLEMKLNKRILAGMNSCEVFENDFVYSLCKIMVLNKPKECSSVFTNDSDFCYFLLANCQLNNSMCDFMENQDFRDKCYTSISKKKEITENIIYNGNVDNWIRDYNITNCEGLRDDWREKFNCIALNAPWFWMCEWVAGAAGNESLREICLARIGDNTKEFEESLRTQNKGSGTPYPVG